ncbi:MAG: HAD family hydrolase [Candidatus Heimdallarchaeota archaeon]
MDKKSILLSFDLDNTLINNREGIVNSFNYALKRYGQTPLERIKIERMIGTPLNEMFASVSNLNPDLLSAAFREYYGSKGIYQSVLILGVKNKLKIFKSYDLTLGIITSKKQEMAERIVDFLKIHKYFDFILGETKGRKVLGKLDPKLKEILLEKYPHHKIIVIGDHPKDVLLSNNLNCPFIGVLTGYHEANELKKLKIGPFLALNSVSDIKLANIYSLLE